jgi:hypothetical protein
MLRSALAISSPVTAGFGSRSVFTFSPVFVFFWVVFFVGVMFGLLWFSCSGGGGGSVPRALTHSGICHSLRRI